MKKKVAKMVIFTSMIVFIILSIILNVILWKKLSSTEPMIRALQNQVDYLESEVVEIESIMEAEEKLEEHSEGEENNKKEATDETVNEGDNVKSEGVGRNLQELIDSEDPEDWLEAAKGSEATEAQLIRIAEKAARINKYDTGSKDKEMQIRIAKAVLENPGTTENVLSEFGKSDFEEVRQISVESMLASTYPEDWIEAAKQSNLEEQLISIAEKSAKISGYSTISKNREIQLRIANTLLENPNTTKRVVEEFTNSRYPEVAEFAEEWLSSH